MQCPSCGFQNLPGLQQCARCRSMLVLDDIDVQPYRASDRGAVTRRVRAAVRAPLRMTDLLERLIGPLRSRDGTAHAGLDIGLPFFWAAISLVPGLGQYLAGRRRAALIIAVAYALLLPVSILLMGFDEYGILFAALVGLHTYAFVNSMTYHVECVKRSTFILAAAAVFFLLQFAVYPAIGYAIGGVARLQGVTAEVPGTRLTWGDVVLIEGRWFAPKQFHPGDLVSYDLGERWAGHTYTAGGTYMDYVLAGPGDRVTVGDGWFLVNGRALPPELRHTLLPDAPGFAENVPPNTFFIYPLSGTGGDIRAGQAVDRLLLEISLVPRRQIHGRALCIVSPPGRWGGL